MSDARVAASVPFDTRPLVDPVDRAAVREFARRLRAEGRAPSSFGSAGSIIAIVVVVFVFVAFGGIFVSMFATIFALAFASAEEGAQLGGLAVLLPFVVIGLAVALVVVAVVRGASARSERWYRLDRFASANGMSYVPVLADPALPGMVFGIGGARQSSDLVRGDRPRFVEFANYRYTTGSGKNRTTHVWGYAAVKLDVPLPHIVLDATGNNSLFGSNLPASFDTDQRLSLEGDFDEHFSLYCPEGYERDALYLFTPDIMARFIDSAAALDVEIVDDWLFLCAKRDFSTLDPATWAWLFSVVGALVDKLAQWARWRDERLQSEGTPWVTDASAAASVGSAASAAAGAVPFPAPAALLRPPPGVAQPGRRLTRRIPWVGIVIGVAFLAVWFLFQYGGIAWLMEYLGR